MHAHIVKGGGLLQPLRFLHAADLHLDSPFKGMSVMPESLRERVRESTFLALQRLVRLAVEERVDFALISGDVYDLADRSLRAQIRFQKAMEQLAEHDIPVFIIHGNHDPEDGRAARLNWPETVHFFASDRVETVDVEKPGRGIIAQIHGISYRTSAVTENLALQFHAGDSAVCQIGLLHTNVDGDPAHDNYAPCSKADLLQTGMHYWALGHVHTRKVVHTEPVIAYPGNIQGRSIRECGPRGCYIVDVHTAGEADLAFHALDSLRWFQERVSIHGLQSEQELRELLEQRMEEIRQAADGRASIVRFTLEGRGALYRRLKQGKALEELCSLMRDEEMERIGGRGGGAGALAGVRGFDEEAVGRMGHADPADFVWIESIEDRTGLEIDREALLQQRSYIGDLLRLAQALRLDDAALAAFAGEALAALQAQPQAAKLAAAEPEQLREWLRAAEELAAGLLAADGGWSG